MNARRIRGDRAQARAGGMDIRTGEVVANQVQLNILNMAGATLTLTIYSRSGVIEDVRIGNFSGISEEALRRRPAPQ